MSSMLEVRPDFFSVKDGKFSSNKRYLAATNTTQGYLVFLPQLNNYTMEMQYDNGDGKQPGSQDVPFNFQYSLNNHTEYVSKDSYFRGNSTPFILEK